MKKNKQIIIIAIAAVLIGMFSGYILGYAAAINWVVDRGIDYMNMKGIDIPIDKKMLVTGLLQYKEQIGGCLFTEENAPLYYDPGY